MVFNLEEHNEAITQFADYLKEELDSVYDAYATQDETEIKRIFISEQENLLRLSSEIQTKIIEFTKCFITLSKSRPFFLRDIEIKNTTVDIIVTTNIIDLTHEDHKAFLEMMNICDDTDIIIGTGESIAITIVFTIKGE